jgi:hypothetical protein
MVVEAILSMADKNEISEQTKLILDFSLDVHH